MVNPQIRDLLKKATTKRKPERISSLVMDPSGNAFVCASHCNWSTIADENYFRKNRGPRYTPFKQLMNFWVLILLLISSFITIHM